MKVIVVRHFICLKTKMTEFRVGCFHIGFFPRQKTHTLKVLNNVQVVNNYFTQSKNIVSSFFWNKLSVK